MKNDIKYEGKTGHYGEIVCHECDNTLPAKNALIFSKEMSGFCVFLCSKCAGYPNGPSLSLLMRFCDELEEAIYREREGRKNDLQLSTR